jgi:RNA-directed DNA polymerase
VLNQTFSELRLKKHPDKTFIGRIKGFNFLGYYFSPEGLSMAEKTIENSPARTVRLYQREQGKRLSSPLLELYVQRWVRWAFSV